MLPRKTSALRSDLLRFLTKTTTANARKSTAEDATLAATTTAEVLPDVSVPVKSSVNSRRVRKINTKDSKSVHNNFEPYNACQSFWNLAETFEDICSFILAICWYQHGY